MTSLNAPLPRDAPLGLYIHIPFCAHICPYCDFTTYAGKESLIGRYVDALAVEVQQKSTDRPVETVFFGGGTPSMLEPEQVAAVLEACSKTFTLAPDAEITMESNPNGLTVERLRGYREAGVNRLSIGAQTLDRRGLRTLGRQHEATHVLEALDAARVAGFDSVSLDFIFGWPGQTLDHWRRDLETLLCLPSPPDHLSLYSLIVEPGTPFADAAARGILVMPDDDATADMYELAIDLLAEAGWLHYEVANWARSAEHASRHNAIYWRQGDYLGIGAGAHQTLDGVRSMNHLLPETYMAALAGSETAASNAEAIDEVTERAETMLLGLRLLESGVDTKAFSNRHGVDLDEVYGLQVAELVAQGLLERTKNGVRLTPRGLLLANDVIARFL